MPKARRLVKHFDDWIIREDEKLEREYLHRIKLIQGQLESTKKLSRSDKLRLYNELYSAQQAIGSIRQGIKIAMLAEMIDLMKEKKPEKAIDIGYRLFEVLNRKNTE